MITFAMSVALLAVQPGPPPASAPSREAIEAAEVAFLSGVRADIERSLKEAGISPVGLVALTAEFRPGGTFEVEKDAFAKVEAAHKHWEVVRTSPTPRAIQVVNAARDVRATRRALIDVLAVSREKVLLQLSPSDLKIFLQIDGRRGDAVLLGSL